MSTAFNDLVARLDRDPAAPWLTDVDLAGGARTELSVSSAVNAVAKAAHLVGGVCAELGRPAVVDLRLPLGWQAVTLLLGCWGAGATVLLAPAGQACDVVVLGPDAVADPPDDLPDTVWASRLHPFGLAFAVPPRFPVEDLAPLLRSQPDLPPPDRAHVDGIAARLAGEAVTHADLGDRAQRLARDASASTRLLTVLPLTSLDGLVAATSLPAGAARSVVLARGASELPGAVTGLASSDRVTATVGLGLPGLPRLG